MKNETSEKKVRVFLEHNGIEQSFKIGVNTILILAGVLVIFKLGKEILKEMEGMGL